MKFDFVIGNPPYQQPSKGANENDTPIYHLFFIESFKIGKRVELISPARFLFNAGGTPVDWNTKMLNDEHVKVMAFYGKSQEVFSNTDIKGGVAVTYMDSPKNYGAIQWFTPFPLLNSICKKVSGVSKRSLSEIVTNRGIYRYSDKIYEEEPQEVAKSADRRIAPSAFERMPRIFTEDRPKNRRQYIQIYGNIKSERVYRWVRKDFVKDVDNLYKYKVLVPKATGNGVLGEVLSSPLVCAPMVGFTETYISIGQTDEKEEAEAILKYIKSKFARVMLGVLKVTQNISKETWEKVPLQDFTKNSDINWNVSIPNIDKQLYKKYGLTDEEVSFIETNVKEME